MTGLWDLFDGMIAETLGVDVTTFVNVIESEILTDEEQEIIIMGVLEGNEMEKEKAIELFNQYLIKYNKSK